MSGKEQEKSSKSPMEEAKENEKKLSKKLSINDITIFCKRKGFVFPTSEIYGGLSGFFDYGPLGVELLNNIKNEWWDYHVHKREDIVGMYGSIITNPKVWVASGHTEHFSDVLVECKKCHQRFRADHLIEEKTGIKVEGSSIEEMERIIKEKNIKCPKCGGELSEPKSFNLMFQTFVGPEVSDASRSYLRPETAQLIFTNFKIIQEVSRKKLPFGIAQVGKAFRNEISPRNFLFRAREFEQAEIEYFINEDDINECPFFDEFKNYKVKLLSEEMQEKNEEETLIELGKAFEQGLIKTKWHVFWIGYEHRFLVNLGLNPEHIRVRQQKKDERAHYSLDTWDLEYKFPFGWKEIEGIANRTTYDLENHIRVSKKDLRYYDEEKKQKIIPYVVAEPSLGLDRVFLALLFDSYNYDEERKNIVLKLKPKVAPFKVGVFPLLSNKKELVDYARIVYEKLSEEFNCFFDKSGSIGRRYARQDEIGTPYCVTIDFDSLENKDVTIRFRDSARQIRVKVDELVNTIKNLIREGVTS